MPCSAGTEFGGDVLGGLTRAFAEIARLVAVAQFDGFVLAGGCAGGHSGASHAAVGEKNIRFDGGVATRVENLSTNYLYDFHWCCPLSWFCGEIPVSHTVITDTLRWFTRIPGARPWRIQVS